MVLIWDLSFGRIRVYQEVAAWPDLLLPGTHGHIPERVPGGLEQQRDLGFTASESEPSINQPPWNMCTLNLIHNKPALKIHLFSDVYDEKSEWISEKMIDSGWVSRAEIPVKWGVCKTTSHANKTLFCWFCSALLCFFFQRRSVFTAKEFVASP